MALYEIPAGPNDAILVEVQALATEVFDKLKNFVGPEIKIHTAKFFYGSNGDFFAQFKRRHFVLTRVSSDKKPGIVAVLNSVDVAIAMAGYMWSLPPETIKSKVKSRDLDEELQDIYKEVSNQIFSTINQRASAQNPGALFKFITEDIPANGKGNDFVDDDVYLMALMDVSVGDQEPAPFYMLFSESVLSSFFLAKLNLGGEASASSSSSSSSSGTSLAQTPVNKITITDHPVVDVDKTVEDAYSIMDKKDIESLPITDEDGRVIRVITKNNIEIMKSIFFNVPGVEERAARVMCVPLALVNKNQELISVGPDDTLAQAIRLMVMHRIHSVPVLEEDGSFAGMITAFQVMNLLAPFAPPKKSSKSAGSRRRAGSGESAQTAVG